MNAFDNLQSHDQSMPLIITPDNSLLPSLKCPKQSYFKMQVYYPIFLTTISIIASPFFLYQYITHQTAFHDIWVKGRKKSIIYSEYYKNKHLLAKIWNSVSGQLYLKGGLEYQANVGYCPAATTRCILRSIPSHIPIAIPPMVSSSSLPPKVAAAIDNASTLTKTTVIYGNEGYEAFLSAIKLSNNPKYRVAVNYLRSALYGITLPFLHNILLGYIGGHFSPVIGYLPDQDLVAIFDVNHNYGVFLVDTKRLYDAVNTYDIMSKTTRGLVLTEITGSGDDNV